MTENAQSRDRDCENIQEEDNDRGSLISMAREETNLCSICLEDISSDECYSLNCDHRYHRDCITRWLHRNPTCPMCRTPVDADNRYVDDGIMSEERRLYIENMRAVCVWSATALEWVFPNGLSGYTEKLTEYLDSDYGKQMLESIQTTDSVPSELLWTIGGIGLMQYLANNCT